MVGRGSPVRGEEAEGLERGFDVGDERVLPAPQRGVAHGLRAELGAGLAERGHAVGAVVLQARVLVLERVRRARSAEARQREVVVQRQHALRLVERLEWRNYIVYYHISSNTSITSNKRQTFMLIAV